MNLLNIITSSNYNKLKILYYEYCKLEDINTCQCGDYSPHIKYGSCRFCWKYGRKSDNDILKIILKLLDNKI